MAADKDGVDELCVGLLMNKTKQAKLSKSSQGSTKTQFTSCEEVDMRKVVTSEIEPEDIDSNDDDDSRENQFLQLVEDCRQEIQLLKRELYSLKLEVANLSQKHKKD